MRPLLYTPSGRAGEYADHGYAANLYRGCTHRCMYCYAPAALRMGRDAFHSKVAPAPNALERLRRDMMRVGLLQEPVFLCFSCDPYNVDGSNEITREAIKIIIGHANRVNILTKGGTMACNDFDLLKKSGSLVGATLTFASPTLSREWEPGAASHSDRLAMLLEAKRNGIETWASIEPVIVPEESLRIMEHAMPVVDTFKIGKWNHDKRAAAIDWAKFLYNAVNLCEAHGKAYVIKQDLLGYKNT